MKKCPFCKSEIEDNASFCLFCMAQLDEKSIITAKKKSRWILISLSCVVVLLLVSFLLFWIFDNSAEDTSSAISSVEESSVEDNSGENNESESQTPQEIKYKYRNSVHGDEVNGYGVSASYIENGITIIGVETVSENGVYVIPETINGKKVIAIASNAFCEEHIKDTVKTVVVPKTVVGIQNYAFSKCYNMTDLYIQGESVAGGPNLFFPSLEKANGTITLHASKTCNDRNFNTFAGVYSYNAITCGKKLVWKFEEWDGVL